MYSPERVVQRERETYRDPRGNVHRFWVLGLNPASGVVKLPTVQEVSPGTVYREWLAEAAQSFHSQFWMRQGWRTSDTLTIAEVTRRADAVMRAWKSPVAEGDGLTPEQAAIERLYTLLEWYVVADDNGQPGRPIREAPFVYPASCAAEGLYTERINPDGFDNHTLETVSIQQLVPYRGQNPATVARWWGAYHFGFPRVRRTKWARPGTKERLPNTDPHPLIPPDPGGLTPLPRNVPMEVPDGE